MKCQNRDRGMFTHFFTFFTSSTWLYFMTFKTKIRSNSQINCKQVATVRSYVHKVSLAFTTLCIMPCFDSGLILVHARANMGALEGQNGF